MHFDFEGFRFGIDVENVYKYVVVGALLKKRANMHIERTTKHI